MGHTADFANGGDEDRCQGWRKYRDSVPRSGSFLDAVTNDGQSEGNYLLHFYLHSTNNRLVQDPAPTPQDCEMICEFSVTLGALLLLLVGVQVSWREFYLPQGSIM